jgi:Tfp pilus assembly protein PilF
VELPDGMCIPDDAAREAFIRGYRHQVEGDLHEAERFYRESLDHEPTAEAHTFLGWAYGQREQLDRAIEQCMKAIDVDPDFGNPYNDIGAYLLRKGNMKQSMEWFKKALEAPRYESYCFPHFNLGRVHRMRGHFTEALNHFHRALDEQPDFEQAEEAIREVRSRFN